MISINVIAVGKMKEKFYIDAFNEYVKRLGAYCKFSFYEVPESTLDSEAEAVIKYLDKKSYVISMCIEGKKMSSEALADRLSSLAVNGTSCITFIVGGSFGLSDKIKDLSNFRLSMSDMTFPHHLARVMLLEQIYRAFKINEGSSYHK